MPMSDFREQPDISGTELGPDILPPTDSSNEAQVAQSYTETSYPGPDQLPEQPSLPLDEVAASLEADKPAASLPLLVPEVVVVTHISDAEVTPNRAPLLGDVAIQKARLPLDSTSESERPAATAEPVAVHFDEPSLPEAASSGALPPDGTEPPGNGGGHGNGENRDGEPTEDGESADNDPEKARSKDEGASLDKIFDEAYWEVVDSGVDPVDEGGPEEAYIPGDVAAYVDDLSDIVEPIQLVTLFDDPQEAANCYDALCERAEQAYDPQQEAESEEERERIRVFQLFGEIDDPVYANALVRGLIENRGTTAIDAFLLIGGYFAEDKWQLDDAAVILHEALLDQGSDPAGWDSLVFGAMGALKTYVGRQIELYGDRPGRENAASQLSALGLPVEVAYTYGRPQSE